MLQDFLNFFINRYCGSNFFQFKVIYIGGGRNVIDLMHRNTREEFFAKQQNVISVLDGDQNIYSYAQQAQVYCVPFESVEKELHRLYHSDQSLTRIHSNYESDGKKIYKTYIATNIMSQSDIFELICDRNRIEIMKFKSVLEAFLNQ